jgi:excisionase family DNA binding protein
MGKVQPNLPPKEWLKNSEVRKLLKVSSNTVQRLRISGKLPSTKVGGVHYYRRDDIEKLLDSGR